jgi:hypothetical protein
MGEDDSCKRRPSSHHVLMRKRHDGPAKPAAREADVVYVHLAKPDRDRLERLAKRLGATHSDVLRRGLLELESQTRPAGARGTVAPLPTFNGNGLQPGVTLDNPAALLDLMDGCTRSGTRHASRCMTPA